MTTPDLTIVQVTDLHVNAPGLQDDKLFADTTESLKRCFAQIARMTPKPALLVLSGDLTNTGEPDSYRALAALLEAHGPDIPTVMALGNHDRRPGFAEAFPALMPDPSKPYDHDRVVAGLHVIALDSAVPGAIGGDWEPGQIDWLKGRLDDHADLPKLLVIHHPPMVDFDNPDLAFESLSAEATAALREAVAGRNVVGILSGHIHLDRVIHWHGIPIVIGMGNHAGTDPVDMSDGIDMVDGTSFTICTLRPSGLMATFVPLPQTRVLRNRITLERIREYLAEMELAAE